MHLLCTKYLIFRTFAHLKSGAYKFVCAEQIYKKCAFAVQQTVCSSYFFQIGNSAALAVFASFSVYHVQIDMQKYQHFCYHNEAVVQ